MPPEVCQVEDGHYSRQGRASDIWALGLFIFLPTIIFYFFYRCPFIRNDVWLPTV
jgi:hypothetical protein